MVWYPILLAGFSKTPDMAREFCYSVEPSNLSHKGKGIKSYAKIR